MSDNREQRRNRNRRELEDNRLEEDSDQEEEEVSGIQGAGTSSSFGTSTAFQSPGQYSARPTSFGPPPGPFPFGSGFQSNQNAPRSSINYPRPKIYVPTEEEIRRGEYILLSPSQKEKKVKGKREYLIYIEKRRRSETGEKWDAAEEQKYREKLKREWDEAEAEQRQQGYSTDMYVKAKGKGKSQSSSAGSYPQSSQPRSPYPMSSQPRSPYPMSSYPQYGNQSSPVGAPLIALPPMSQFPSLYGPTQQNIMGPTNFSQANPWLGAPLIAQPAMSQSPSWYGPTPEYTQEPTSFGPIPGSFPSGSGFQLNPKAPKFTPRHSFEPTPSSSDEEPEIPEPTPKPSYMPRQHHLAPTIWSVPRAPTPWKNQIDWAMKSGVYPKLSPRRQAMRRSDPRKDSRSRTPNPRRRGSQ